MTSGIDFVRVISLTRLSRLSGMGILRTVFEPCMCDSDSLSEVNQSKIEDVSLHLIPFMYYFIPFRCVLFFDDAWEVPFFGSVVTVLFINKQGS